jgi:hypothetical protein
MVELGMLKKSSSRLPHVLERGRAVLFGTRIYDDENCPCSLPSSDSRATSIFLSGYFQSWDCFKREISHVANIANRALEERHGKSAGARVGAVHLRLGDYAGLKHIYGEITGEYIYQSILELSSRHPSKSNLVNVYSDSVNASGSLQVPNFVNLHYMPNQTTPEALWAMSQSLWIVGSNSTFSWWAAAIGGFIPLTLPSPFLIDRKLNSKIRLESDNVVWIDRSIS